MLRPPQRGWKGPDPRSTMPNRHRAAGTEREIKAKRNVWTVQAEGRDRDRDAERDDGGRDRDRGIGWDD